MEEAFEPRGRRRRAHDEEPPVPVGDVCVGEAVVAAAPVRGQADEAVGHSTRIAFDGKFGVPGTQNDPAAAFWLRVKNISDEGVKMLMIHLDLLEHLVLKGTAVADDSMLSIGQSNCTSLSFLDVKKCCITDQGLLNLMQHGKMSQLSYINLSYTLIS